MQRLLPLAPITLTRLLLVWVLIHPVTAEELPLPLSVTPGISDLEEIHGYISPNTATSSSQPELITERYPNRTVKLTREVIQDAERNYVNHGSWTMYDHQGQVSAQGTYRHGKRHGTWTQAMAVFPMAEATFRAPFTSRADFNNGELHGQWTLIDAQQRKVGSWEFEYGQLHGVARTWYPNGQERRAMKFVRGNPDGEAMAWVPNGNVWAREFFRDGKQLIPVVTWHDRDQKESEGWMIQSNFRFKTHVDWWNGTLEIVREETEGDPVKTGMWTEWYADGGKKFAGAYKDGEPVGQHTWWHPNGLRMAIGGYKAGLSEGLWTRWHPNGQKQEEGTYLAGVQRGKWTVWADDGQIADVQYMAGNEIIASDEDDSDKHNVSHLLGPQ